ncbi:head protein [Haloarcula californiae icosahedral virus 1]|uniref:Putative VP13 n=1 Tax=Haloarcula californiae icosahedral virus 1 TaxID=1735722 RepID=A0A1C7A3R4_9VIRU|nr:head protein [Haloarcula californiae icosahedral virus 1]ALJ99686.1 putative VP13 [Haloarcula californiae icosahedral virus 1]
MGVKDQIRDLDEYQPPDQGGQQGGQQATTQAAAATGRQGGQTVGTALGPVLDWEKTDVEFWMQVAQVVLLYLILRELRKGA